MHFEYTFEGFEVASETALVTGDFGGTISARRLRFCRAKQRSSLLAGVWRAASREPKPHRVPLAGFRRRDGKSQLPGRLECRAGPLPLRGAPNSTGICIPAVAAEGRAAGPGAQIPVLFRCAGADP